VLFASSGEKLEDFDVFHPDRMASRILDLGDILTLIEQAERTFDAEQAATMADKLASGDGITLEDFVEQLAMVRKLGPIGNLLGMLPGAAQNREALSQISDADLDRAVAIVNSMTVEERRNPKMINGSRRARIAGGSGVTVGEVNSLIVRFLEAQKIMRQAMGGFPGMRRPKAGGAKGKKKSKGGRPGGNAAARAAGRAGAAQGAGGTAGVGAAAGAAGGGAGGAGEGLPGLPGLPGGVPGLAGGIPGLSDGLLGGQDGGPDNLRLPPGLGPRLATPQPGLPPGLRGGRPGRRGRSGKKGK
jgi:signal recognition particle subunit SRP54